MPQINDEEEIVYTTWCKDCTSSKKNFRVCLGGDEDELPFKCKPPSGWAADFYLMCIRKYNMAPAKKAFSSLAGRVRGIEKVVDKVMWRGDRTISDVNQRWQNVCDMEKWFIGRYDKLLFNSFQGLKQEACTEIMNQTYRFHTQ
jgi:hypothetical protein